MNLKVVDIVHPVDEAIVQMAERLLSEARAGNVSELAYVARLKDGAVRTDWSAAENFAERIGHLEMLKARMIMVHMRDD